MWLNLIKFLNHHNYRTLQVLEMRIGVNEEQINHLSNQLMQRGTNTIVEKPADINFEDSRGKSKPSENPFASNALHQGTGGFTPTLFGGFGDIQ